MREIKTSVRIKYDLISLKILKWTAIVSTLLFFTGVSLMSLEIDGTELFSIIGLYMGGGLGIAAYINLIAGKMYLNRLGKYGYEIPYYKKKYDGKIENLPKLQNGQKENCKSLYSRDSKRLSYIGSACFVVFTALDIRIYVKWNFMKDNCISVIIMTMIFYCIWMIMAFVTRMQSNPEKYRDDVEPDKTRKERLSFENGIITYIVLGCICLFVNSMAQNAIDYTEDGEFSAQECVDTYQSLCNGAEVTTWEVPSDSLQENIYESVLQMADGYFLTDGQAQIYVQITEGKADVQVLNQIPQVVQFWANR